MFKELWLIIFNMSGLSRAGGRIRSIENTRTDHDPLNCAMDQKRTEMIHLLYAEIGCIRG